MAFPSTRLPVTVETAPGADPAADPGTWTWTDITSSVRLRDRIYIAVGRADESARVAPATCRMRLDNRTGNFTPRNPLGQWYGTLGRNTPLRVRVTLEGAASVVDQFGRTVVDGFGSADTGQTYTLVGPAADFDVNTGQGRITPSATGSDRIATVDTGSANHECQVVLETNTTPVGGVIRYGLAARFTDANNHIRVIAQVDTAGVVTAEVSARAGGTLTLLASVDTGLSIATNVIVKARVVSSRVQLKVWHQPNPEPAAWTIDIIDTTVPATGTRCGPFARREAGNTSPTTLDFDSFTAGPPIVDRFSGFVSAWPPRWDKSGNDATVPIEANGVLRRLGQGTPPVKSALRRATPGSNPGAYWPCEDGGDATQAASAIVGHPPITVSGVANFAQFTVETPGGNAAVGSLPLPDLKDGGTLRATVPADVTAACVSQWAVQFLGEIKTGSISTDFDMLEVLTPGGTYVRWRWFAFMSGAVLNWNLKAYNSSGVETHVNGGAGQDFGAWRLTATQNGGNIDVRLYLGNKNAVLSSVAGTLAGPTQITVNPTGATATQPAPFGHITLWPTATPTLKLLGDNVDSYGVALWVADLNPWALETAHDRLTRLCVEDGVSLTVPAVAVDFVTRMGPQPAATFLDLAYESPDADQGVLYESGFGLGFLPREHRYNRPVSLALDFAAGQIADPPEPADDDQGLRNRVTVNRSGGSSATAQDAASITKHGPYVDEVTVNHSDDTALADHAAWRLHLGTVDEMRWPRIDLNLAASPELVDAWLSCGVQSRVTAVNPPPEVAGDDIDVVIEGYTEVLGYKDWDVAINASPASPWTVATADGQPRVASEGSTLGGSLTSGGTSFSLASTAANGVWTTAAADFPLDVNVGGEKIRLSAISGSTSPQTATVDTGGRSLNGVVKAHSAGTAVDVWLPAVVAL